MLKALERYVYRKYYRSSIGGPYHPKSNWFWYVLWKKLFLWRSKREVCSG